jgi:protein-tyrosine kinase
MDGSGMERVKKPLQLAGHDRPGSSEVLEFADAAADSRDAKRRFGDGAEIEYSQTRVIDAAPAVLERMRIVAGRADEIGNAYKLLRTHVLQRLVAKGWQTVAVVSPAAGEGKTLTAINLALALGSTRSHTALLVDLDWRQPSVHTYFGYEPEFDVYDYLRGECGIADALVSPGLSRFCFLPCKRPVADASELLGSLSGFVGELKGRYANRVVLFDLPPLLATDDALSFLPFVDGVLLVVEEGRTKREDVQRSLELIGEDKLLGSVINKSWHKPPKY